MVEYYGAYHNDGTSLLMTTEVILEFINGENTSHDHENGNYHYSSRCQGLHQQTLPLIITESTSTAPQFGNYYWTQLGTDIDGMR